MERQKTRAFLLRLSPSLREEAVLLAKSEGISLNHFISIALAERMIRLEATQNAIRDRKNQNPVMSNRTTPMPSRAPGAGSRYNDASNTLTRPGGESGQ